MAMAHACAQLTTNFVTLSKSMRSFTLLLHSYNPPLPSNESNFKFVDMLRDFTNLQQKTQDSLEAVCFIWGFQQSPQQHSSARQLQNVCSGHVTSLSTALAQALRVMQRLGSAADRSGGFTHTTKLSFVMLWEFTCQLSNGYTFWSIIDSNLFTVDMSEIYPVWDNLLNWLQPLVRKPELPAMQAISDISRACRTWQAGVHSLINMMVMRQAVILSTPSTQHLASAFLPGSHYLAKMCCLLCDTASLYTTNSNCTGATVCPDKPRFTKTVVILANSLHAMYNLEGHYPSTPRNSDLLCPAALQVVKLAVQFTSSDPAACPNIAKLCLSTLMLMLHSTPLNSQATMPELLPRSTTSDQQLLSNLRVYAFTHKECLAEVTNAMQAVLYSWGHKLVCEQDIACLPESLQFCHLHLGAWMKQQQPLTGKTCKKSLMHLQPKALEGLQRLLWNTFSAIQQAGESLCKPQCMCMHTLGEWYAVVILMVCSAVVFIQH